MFLAVLAAIAWVLATRYDRRVEGVAFIGGYLSHVLVDVLPAAMAGEWAKLGSLLWPITPVYEYPDETDYSIIGFFLELELAEVVSFELGLTIVAIALWIFDGRPGSGTIVRVIRRYRSGSE